MKFNQQGHTKKSIKLKLNWNGVEEEIELEDIFQNLANFWTLHSQISLKLHQRDLKKKNTNPNGTNTLRDSSKNLRTGKQL